MATLHLPKKRLVSSKEEPIRSAQQRTLDEGVDESLPASDPVSSTAPGTTREDEARNREHPSR